MAELDPSIIFRQKEYAGPTQDELDAKQDMNALRNMLGAGRAIDSPEVVNAMMARNPDLGLKLMTNASTMQTNQASLQAKQQEARIARLNRLVPTALAIAKNKDQPAWSQFKTYLQQIDPEAVMGYPDNVEQAETFVQNFIDAQRAQKGVSSPGAKAVQTADGVFMINPDNTTTPLIGPDGRQVMSLGMGVAQTNADVRRYGIDVGADTAERNRAAAAERQVAKAMTDAGMKGVTRGVVVAPGQQPGADQPGVAASVPEAKRMTELRAALPKARAALGAAEDKLTSLGTDISALINDPALKKITGDELAQYRGSFPSLFGADAARAQSKLETIIARGVFSELADIKQQSPTGSALGSVSDKEGALLAAGFGELKQAKSAKDMVAALNKIRVTLARSQARLRGTFAEEFGPVDTAGAPPAGGATAPDAPKIGDVVEGYIFLGGDPSKQENWSK